MTPGDLAKDLSKFQGNFQTPNKQWTCYKIFKLKQGDEEMIRSGYLPNHRVSKMCIPAGPTTQS